MLSLLGYKDIALFIWDVYMSVWKYTNRPLHYQTQSLHNVFHLNSTDYLQVYGFIYRSMVLSTGLWFYLQIYGFIYRSIDLFTGLCLDQAVMTTSKNMHSTVTEQNGVVQIRPILPKFPYFPIQYSDSNNSNHAVQTIYFGLPNAKIHN